MRGLPILAVTMVSVAVVLTANRALAAQVVPSMNAIQTVCTGVGSEQDDPRWKSYPLKIVLATTGGAYLANAHITLTKNGQTLAQADCDAPWVLFQAPAGHYSATATLIGGSGESQSVSFNVGRTGQTLVTILFKP